MSGVMGEDGLVPRARSRLPVVCSVGLGLLMLLFAWLLDSDRFRERAGMIAFCITVERFIHSMCLFAEEWLFHSRQRLENSLYTIYVIVLCKLVAESDEIFSSLLKIKILKCFFFVCAAMP